MSEPQLSDLLAQDAPFGGANLAQDVIDRAGKHRRRRRAMAGACASVALIAAVPLAVALNRSPHSGPRAVAGANQARPAVTSPAPISAASDVALVYAAGIKYLAGQLVPGKHWRTLYVIDRVCVNGISPDQACGAQALPADVRHDLAAALHSFAPVRFVSKDAKIRGKDLQVTNEGVAVTLGRIQLDGGAARLPLAVQCGGLCGMGETLLLRKSNGIWTVTGQTGPAWIS